MNLRKTSLIALGIAPQQLVDQTNSADDDTPDDDSGDDDSGGDD